MKASDIEKRYRENLLASLSDPPSSPVGFGRVEDLVKCAEEELQRARVKARQLVESAEAQAQEASRRAELEGRRELAVERRRLVGQQVKGRELLRVIELRAEEGGRSRGRAAGRVEAARETLELRRRAGQALEALEAARAEVGRERERRAVELACGMVEVCLGIPAGGLPSLYREAFLRFLAAGRSAPGERLRLACHPSLVSFLRTLAPARDGRVEIEPDPTAPVDRVRLFGTEEVHELCPAERRVELEALLLGLAAAEGGRANGAGD